MQIHSNYTVITLDYQLFPHKKVTKKQPFCCHPNALFVFSVTWGQSPMSPLTYYAQNLYGFFALSPAENLHRPHDNSRDQRRRHKCQKPYRIVAGGLALLRRVALRRVVLL